MKIKNFLPVLVLTATSFSQRVFACAPPINFYNDTGTPPAFEILHSIIHLEKDMFGPDCLPHPMPVYYWSLSLFGFPLPLIILVPFVTIIVLAVFVYKKMRKNKTD